MGFYIIAAAFLHGPKPLFRFQKKAGKETQDHQHAYDPFPAHGTDLRSFIFEARNPNLVKPLNVCHVVHVGAKPHVCIRC